MTSERARRRARRRRHRRRVAGWCALTLAVATLISIVVIEQGGSEDGSARSTTASTESAVSTPSTGPPVSRTPTPAENVAFRYEPIRADTDLSILGHVKIVVSSRQDDPRAPEAIHRIGAKAYRYVQTYWFPSGPDRDGVDLSANPGQGFCRDGSQPVVGRRTADGEPLTYLDMNEREVRQAFALRFALLRSQGWDGVFLDRGYAALTGIDSERAGIWNRVSSCTADPVTPGATFADSYLGMASEVAAADLELMFNYGVSPFDPATPLRPDPRSPKCATLPNPDCPRLDDAWDHTTWILTEAVTHLRDVNWAADFAANWANERDAEHGGQVVGLITDALVESDRSPPTVYYAWSRAKLFSIPIAVGTGIGGCGNAPPGSICNRSLSFPELASTSLGQPVASRPTAIGCDPGDSVHCVWYRQYERGVVVVNVRDRATHAEIPLEGPCRALDDLLLKQPVAEAACVSSLSLDLPPWAGRPFTNR